MGWAIALHGGAGDISKDLPVARKEAAEACLQHCLDLGVSALQSSRTALDVVELVVSSSIGDMFFLHRGQLIILDKGGRTL